MPLDSSHFQPALFAFVQLLNGEITVRASSRIAFDPFRPTPSWKLGQREVHAMLVERPHESARTVRFLAFSGPAVDGDRLPVDIGLNDVAIADNAARVAAAERIVRFFEAAA